MLVDGHVAGAAVMAAAATAATASEDMLASTARWTPMPSKTNTTQEQTRNIQSIGRSNRMSHRKGMMMSVAPLLCSSLTRASRDTNTLETITKNSVSRGSRVPAKIRRPKTFLSIAYSRETIPVIQIINLFVLVCELNAIISSKQMASQAVVARKLISLLTKIKDSSRFSLGTIGNRFKMSLLFPTLNAE